MSSSRTLHCFYVYIFYKINVARYSYIIEIEHTAAVQNFFRRYSEIDMLGKRPRYSCSRGVVRCIRTCPLTVSVAIIHFFFFLYLISLFITYLFYYYRYYIFITTHNFPLLSFDQTPRRNYKNFSHLLRSIPVYAVSNQLF